MSLLQALNLPPRPGIPAAPPKAALPPSVGAAAAPNGKLSQAAEAWRQTHAQAGERIAALKAAVQAHCTDAPPALRQEIERGLARLDVVLGTVDQRLADSLARAGEAADEGARTAELKTARALLAEYIGYVKSEPLVAHADQNPFGVKTGLKALLAAGLASAAKAVA